MLGDAQRERTLGRRSFLQEKRRYARVFEMMLYGLAIFGLATLPLAWLVNGFHGVTGAWNVPVISAFLVALAQWPAHFRRKAERQLREWEESLAWIMSARGSTDSASE